MPVDVYVHCRTAPFGDPGSAPVNSVAVSLHPDGGGLALGSGVTGAGANPDGSVFLGSQNPGTFEVHVTPALGAAIVQEGNLHSIEVDAVLDPQIFDVLIDVSGLPIATDEHFCRCSGTFMDPYGQPVKQLSIHFSEETVSELAYYAATNTVNAVIPKSQVIRTDGAGYASVDLLRGARYQVYLEGFENLSRTIKIPDLTASLLPDVIFPVVDGVEYTKDNALLVPLDNPDLNMVVGQQAVLSLETVHRSGLRVEGLVAVTLTSDDVGGLIIVLSYTDSNTLTLTAVGVGTALLEVARIAPEEGMGISIAPVPELRGTLSVVVVV